jgi:hypothetical protein
MRSADVRYSASSGVCWGGWVIGVGAAGAPT